MNVREIDATKTGIWQFAATAVVLLVLSAYSWCLMRALRNYHLSRKRIRSRTLGGMITPIHVFNELYEACDWSHTKALMYFLGFKRADELGFANL